MSNFDNRELALLYWMFAALVWMLWMPAVRKLLFRLLKALLSKPILVSLFVMVVYICLEVALLQAVGIWALSQLKVTVIWSVTTAFVMLCNINTISEDERFFRKSIGENFKLAVLVDFFVNFHVFPLVAELVLVPFCVLLGGMIAYCDTDEEKYAVIKQLLNNVLLLLGMGLLIYASFKTSQNVMGIVSPETLRNLSVPILLSIFYLPFIFLIVVYIAYENVFKRLQFVIKDASLHSYTKYHMLRRVGFKYPALKTWLKSAWRKELLTRQDIAASIQEAVDQHVQS